MADPFPIELDGRTWLLFEDMPAGNPKSRLGCVEVFDASR